MEQTPLDIYKYLIKLRWMLSYFQLMGEFPPKMVGRGEEILQGIDKN